MSLENLVCLYFQNGSTFKVCYTLQNTHIFNYPPLNYLQLLVNITARSPRLVARGLPPGQVLFLRVYASNTKGRSRSVRIDGYTLRMADKRPGKVHKN